MPKIYTTQARYMLHGGDYNPDQWLDRPDILADDIKLMKLAHTNTFSVGIFSWSALDTILRTPESYTLPIGLYNLVNEVMGASYTTFAAGAILISIPVAVIFIMLQKNFVSGLTAGGTKG
ncbi:hypothetical protein DT075_04840 [Bacillus licheniformis]|nr:hypothetical protein DT075_04840 [Bacillus licheniformis]